MSAPGTLTILCLGLSSWLFLLPVATCMSSHDCVLRLHQSSAAERTARCVNKPICGNFPPNTVNFRERLSPQCAALFDTYRSIWPQRGVTANRLAPNSCPFAAATQAHNPVVVSTNTTATFVMCTVPKVGSTNTRKLINTIVSDPDPPVLDAFDQIVLSHKSKYPNVGHFGVPNSPQPAPSATPAADTGPLWQPPATTTRTGRGGYKPPSSVPENVPTFTLGRNPYIRLVSGYRNKMVFTDGQHDVWTRRLVNRDLGLPDDTEWTDTPADFQSFVRALVAMQAFGSINSHFRSAVRVCAGSPNFRYDYYLRLEELEQWLPCWLHGLALTGYTDRGWARAGWARMYLGASEEEQLVTYRWSRSGHADRPVWDAESRSVTLGERGKDWQWLRGDGCWWKPHEKSCEEYAASYTAEDGSVVPGGSVGAGEGAKGSGDAHGSSTADQWQLYYDQASADAVYRLYSVDFRAFRYSKLTFT
eukprot:jgi/Ulvmu1/11490/UM077_0039.1